MARLSKDEKIKRLYALLMEEDPSKLLAYLNYKSIPLKYRKYSDALNDIGGINAFKQLVYTVLLQKGYPPWAINKYISYQDFLPNINQPQISQPTQPQLQPPQQSQQYPIGFISISYGEEQTLTPEKKEKLYQIIQEMIYKYKAVDGFLKKYRIDLTKITPNSPDHVFYALRDALFREGQQKPQFQDVPLKIIDTYIKIINDP